MNAAPGILEQLQIAVDGGDIAQRATTLRRITDLFVLGSGSFSVEQTDLFDEVLGRIIGEVEISARATLSSRLCDIPSAPKGVIRDLAFDDAIEVAAPVLSRSEQVTEGDLIEVATHKGQSHLQAIAIRSPISSSVTDILLSRGDKEVTRRVADNSRAAISKNGFDFLLTRALRDIDLALSVWSRFDLPRKAMVRLFLDASEKVQNQFELINPRKAVLVREIVTKASSELLSKARDESGSHGSVKLELEKLFALGSLNEERLAEFASLGDFDRTTIALHLLCDIPIELSERAVARNNLEQLIVIAKAAGLSWVTTSSIMQMQAMPDRLTDQEIDQACASFVRLSLKTAQTAMKFYRLRESAKS